jgi:hypothetical protein
VRIVEVEIRLVRIEAMPEIRLGQRIEGPVRFLRVGDDDPRIGVAAVVVGPDVVGPDIEPAPCRVISPRLTGGWTVRFDLDSPEGGLGALEALGVIRYNEELAKTTSRETVVATAAGHEIVTAHCSYGLVDYINGTGKAFAELESAHWPVFS